MAEEVELQLLESESQELTDNDLDDINMWVYIKDKFNISNEAWYERAKCKDLPTKYKICKHLDKLNANWNLNSTPGKAEGIQISLKESLEEQIIKGALCRGISEIKYVGNITWLTSRGCEKGVKLTWDGYFMVKFLIPGMQVCEKTGNTEEISAKFFRAFSELLEINTEINTFLGFRPSSHIVAKNFVK